MTKDQEVENPILEIQGWADQGLKRRGVEHHRAKKFGTTPGKGIAKIVAIGSLDDLPTGAFIQGTRFERPMRTRQETLEWIAELRGNEAREDVLELIESALNEDTENGILWAEAADLYLPPRSRGKPIDPDLSQCAKALRCLRRAVQSDPSMDEAWALGGLLMVDHLGMMEDALEWWSEYSVINPDSPVPLVEQVAIMARYGEFDKASTIMNSIESLDREMLSNSQKRRLEDIKSNITNAAKSDEKDVFRPQDPNHPRWEKISKYRNQKPVSQTYFLFFIVSPFVFMIGFIASAALSPYGAQGQIATFLTILIAFYSLTRVSEPLFRWMNRNATDLDRALDIEMASGKTCIPETIREGRLHKKMLSFRPPAWLERHQRIVTDGQRISRRWASGYELK